MTFNGTCRYSLFLLFHISLSSNSWTGAVPFTLHLHVYTFGLATVGVGLPILATNWLIYRQADTVLALPLMCHLHVDTLSNAPVGVGLPILAADRLIVFHTDTVVAGAASITVHIDAKILGQAAIGVCYSILPTHRLEDSTRGFPFTNPEEHYKSNMNSP